MDCVVCQLVAILRYSSLQCKLYWTIIFAHCLRYVVFTTFGRGDDIADMRGKHDREPTKKVFQTSSHYCCILRLGYILAMASLKKHNRDMSIKNQTHHQLRCHGTSSTTALSNHVISNSMT